MASNQCGICWDVAQPLLSVHTKDLQHLFHEECLKLYIDTSKSMECPYCRQLMDSPELKNFLPDVPPALGMSLALARRDAAGVRLHLMRGADPLTDGGKILNMAKDAGLLLVLFEVILAERWDMARRLLEIMIMRDDAEAIQWLLDHYMDYQNDLSRFLLLATVHSDSTQIPSLLVKLGARPDAEMLFKAAENGHMKVLRFLLDNCIDRLKIKPEILPLVLKRGDFDLAIELADLGVPITYPILAGIIKDGDEEEIFSKLLQIYASKNISDKIRNEIDKLASLAASYNRLEILRSLVQAYSVDCSPSSKAYKEAQRNGDADMLDYLTSINGETALVASPEPPADSKPKQSGPIQKNRLLKNYFRQLQAQIEEEERLPDGPPGDPST